MNNYKTFFACFALISLAACNVNNDSVNNHQDRMDLAEAWLMAANSSKAETIEMVEKNMAEDGVIAGDRYVGMGFIWNPDESGMTVGSIIPDSPASKSLEVGDSFVEVAGVRVTDDNRNRLGFRGKPGEKVDAVVLRDGEEVSITVARGAVRQMTSKAQLLENMTESDAEGWGSDDMMIIEKSATEDGVVWILSWSKFTEEATGLTADAYTATRFVFNDEGKVSRVANLTEDRFVLEQQGYSITR